MREAEAYWVWGIEARDRSGNLDRVGQEGPCHRLGIIGGGGAEGRVSILALLRGSERPQVQKKDEKFIVKLSLYATIDITNQSV